VNRGTGVRAAWWDAGMKSSLLCVALAAVSGCMFIARPVTSEVSVAVHEEAPIDEDGFVGWDIETQMDGPSVVVSAARVQTCTRTRSEVYDVVKTKKLDMWAMPIGDLARGPGAGGLLFVGAFFALFLPITAVSAIVAPIVVASSGATTMRKTRELSTLPGTCAAPAANVHVELTLPSGAALAGATGADGRAHFALAANEPRGGTLITRVADQTRSTMRFDTAEACVRARNAIFARIVATSDLAQRTLLVQSLPMACGDSRDAAWALTAVASLAAIDSRCGASPSATMFAMRPPVRAPTEIVRVMSNVANQVEASDGALFGDVFLAEPDIARCLDSTGAGREARVLHQARHDDAERPEAR